MQKLVFTVLFLFLSFSIVLAQNETTTTTTTATTATQTATTTTTVTTNETATTTTATQTATTTPTTTVTTTQNVTQTTTATIEKCQIGTIRCFENKVQSCLDPSGEGWVTTLDCGGDSQCTITGTNTASCQRYELTNATTIPTCPEKITCTDGSVSNCRLVDNRCSCDTCPIPNDQIPPDCRQEVDRNTGFVKVICEKQTCPLINQEQKNSCIASGGAPLLKRDPSGCDFIECTFTEFRNPIGGFDKCPSEEDVQIIIKKCEATDLRGVIAFEGGCRIAKCAHVGQERCPLISAEIREGKARECAQSGNRVIQTLDESGCMKLECRPRDSCEEIEPRAIRACKESGGEIVIKKNEFSCVIFAECIKRGDDRNIYVEPVSKLPETTDLLDIAFKLESLKVELDKLARKAEDIANYYSSVGSREEERFRRISGMFDSINGKIEEIKDKIRSNLDSLTVEDIIEIKRDVKYLKEVALKDIVFVMLSSSDEVKEIETGSETDCGTDGSCFDRAIRVCKSVSFKPEGRKGPTVEITGLEDGKCVLKVTMEDTPLGKALSMNCKIEKYALGVRGPEDVIPHCEGPLAEMAKRFGGAGSVQGKEFPPPEGGPGGCKSIKECAEYCYDNYDVCVKWTKEHPAYGTPPPRERLKRIAAGELEGFAGPGGCSNEKECREFCSKPENFEECSRFPRDEGFETESRGFESGGIRGGSGSLPPQLPEGGGFTATGEKVACSDCLNNGICDPGECSECADCLRSRR